MKKYIDPFKPEIEEYAKMLDKYFEQKNIEETKKLIENIEKNFETFDQLSKIRNSIFRYSIIWIQ